ncbi:MAG: aspartate dehydrogenase [Dehalococcoidia bacterium]
MKKYNLVFIGCGAICTQIITYLNTHMPNKYDIKMIVDNHIERTNEICAKLNISPIITDQFDDYLNLTNIDIVVESASVNSVQNYAIDILKKSDLLIASVGALSDVKFYSDLLSESASHNNNLIIPHGAIGGLDAISAVKDSISFIKITTTKSPASLIGAKGFKEYENYNFDTAKTIFEGSAKDAIDLFPKNLNVAVTLSLYGVGTDKTNVELIVDPTIKENKHTIYLEGDFGKMNFEFSLTQSLTNPKTSALASLSIIKSLKDY